MAADLANLRIRVDALEAQNATKDLDKLAAAGARAENSTKGLASSFAGIAAALGLGSVISEFVRVNTQFQSLKASLETVEGSAVRAGITFNQLKTFAAQTPFELSELTQALILLKARGLDATMPSLRAYGDMASSFGRTIQDTVQAIAQATVGEMESIKSFGVQSQQMGDKVAFTFKGQTEIVRKSVSSIQDYFKRLAEANFSGGMERQSKTLAGVFSNLKDQIAATFFEIGNAGPSQALVNSVLRLTKAIADLTPTLASLAASAVGGFGVAIDVVMKYRNAVLILLAVGMVPVLNGWIAATARLIAVQAVARVQTLAFAYATAGYSASAIAASMAGNAFGAGIGLLLTPAGLLIAALAAMALAARSYMKETAALNEEVDKQEARFNKAVKPILDMKQEVSDAKDRVKALKEALAGGSTSKLISSEDQRFLRQIKEGGGDMGWAKQVAGELKAVQAEETALKAKVDARNESMKKGAEEAKKHAEALRSMVEKYREEQMAIGLGTDLVERLKAQKMGAGAATLQFIFAVQQEKAAFDASNEALKKQVELRQQMFEAAQAVIDLRPERPEELPSQRALRDDARQLGFDVETPEERRMRELRRLDAMLKGGLIGQEVYRRRWLEIETTAGGALANISQAMTTVSDKMTEAFVQFVTTGKLSFKSLVTSILADLARLQAQRAFTQLLSLALNAYSASSSSNVSGTVEPDASYLSGRAGGGSVYGGTPYMVGERGPEVFVPRNSGTILPNGAGGTTNSIQVTVVVQGDGSSKTSVSGGTGGDAKSMARGLGGVVKRAIQDEMLPGGLLYGRG